MVTDPFDSLGNLETCFVEKTWLAYKHKNLHTEGFLRVQGPDTNSASGEEDILFQLTRIRLWLLYISIRLISLSNRIMLARNWTCASRSPPNPNKAGWETNCFCPWGLPGSAQAVPPRKRIRDWRKAFSLSWT